MDCKSGFEEIECNKQIYWSVIRVEDWWKLSSRKLESTDAAPEVPHPCPTRHDAGRGVWRGCPRVGPHLHFFFPQIRADSARFAPMRLDPCRIGFDSRRTELIRPKSGRIGHIGSAKIGRKTAETCRKQPKLALNMAEKAETCLLLSFFVNQGIVCVF